MKIKNNTFLANSLAEKIFDDRVQSISLDKILQSLLPSRNRPDIALSEGQDIMIIDPSIIESTFAEIQHAFHYACIFTALKAHSNFAPLLHQIGGSFEIATLGELQFLAGLNVEPQKIIFSHPAKARDEIDAAYRYGVRTFVTDSLDDMNLIGEFAPGSGILVRLAEPGAPMTHDQKDFHDRFGVDALEAIEILKTSKIKGLIPLGVCFHPGTQRESIDAWDNLITEAGKIFGSSELKNAGIELYVLDLGGGMPARHRNNMPNYQEFADHIWDFIAKNFEHPKNLRIIIEPGRSISAMAGVIIGRVVNVKMKNGLQIVTITTGKYSAGIYGIGNNIHFLRTQNGDWEELRDNLVPSLIFGKACASIDNPFEGEQMLPPVSENDIVVITGTGAYSRAVLTNWCSKSQPILYVEPGSDHKFTTEEADILKAPLYT